MGRRYFKSLICLIFMLMSSPHIVNAQQNEGSDIINIFNADNFIKIMSDSLEIDSLRGNVKLYQDSSFMFCDTAILINSKNLIAYGNVVIVQSDSVQVFCDSLYYESDSSMAYLYDHVFLKNGADLIKTDYLEYHLKDKKAYYFTGAVLKRESGTLKSKLGTYFVREKKASFIKSVQFVDTSFTLKTDTLLYDLNKERIDFYGPTLINQDSVEIYCERGYYEIKDKIALFELNPQYRKGESISSSDLIFYDGELGDMIMEGNVEYTESEKNAKALKMVYNEKTKLMTLAGDAWYKGDGKEIFAPVIRYNEETKDFVTKGRTRVIDDSNTIDADAFNYSEERGIGIAEGQVIWQDSTGKLQLFTDWFSFQRDTESMLSYGIVERPLLLNITGDDSLYVAADTFRMIKFVQDSLDTLDFFTADKSVQIFQKGLQAVCDSLSYNLSDSLYRLFKDPFIWKDSMQFSADTIEITFQDSQIDTLSLKNNSMVIIENSEKLYDQIKGKNIDASFVEGDLKDLFVNGNSESIYYVKDKNGKYLGVNKTDCSRTRFIFKRNKLSDIQFLSNPNSNLSPMQLVNHEQMRLAGFNWDNHKKVKNVDEMRKLSGMLR